MNTSPASPFEALLAALRSEWKRPQMTFKERDERNEERRLARIAKRNA